MAELILAGDLGATKTNLAVFSVDKGPRSPLVEATLDSASYGSFTDLLKDFLDQVGEVYIRRAAFGVAGPVIDGRSRITKLSWVVDQDQLADDLGLSEVIIVNDLVATAYGMGTVEPADLFVLSQGRNYDYAPQAVIAPGTGLGEAFLLWQDGRYVAHASEGGHTLFSPVYQRQRGLLSYLHQQYESVSFDMVCSGRGLPLIYEYLASTREYSELSHVAAELAVSSDPSPIISRMAQDIDAPSPLCAATLDLFVEIMAVEASNLCLTVMATGGLFIAGGIPPRILPVLREKFIPAFIGKGPLSELLAAIPVQVALNPKSALLGAARLLLPALKL